MPDFSTLGLGQRWLGGVNTGSRGQNVIPSATANTKGVYANLITAANNLQDSVGLLLNLGGVVNTNNEYLVDIAIGAAGSEAIIIPNLHTMVGSGGVKQGDVYYFPIAIPAGVRVAARCQAAVASASNCHVLATFVAQGALPSSPLQRVTTYGANTADSGGVELDPGGTANAKGAWFELTSSSTADCRLLLVSAGVGTNVSPTAANWLVDIGVGAAGSEVVLLPNLGFVWSVGTLGDGSLTPASYGALPVQIPTGSRIAARAQCSINTSPARLRDIIVYGID